MKNMQSGVLIQAGPSNTGIRTPEVRGYFSALPEEGKPFVFYGENIGCEAPLLSQNNVGRLIITTEVKDTFMKTITEVGFLTQNTFYILKFPCQEEK